MAATARSFDMRRPPGNPAFDTGVLLLCLAGALALRINLGSSGESGSVYIYRYPVADHWPPFVLTYRAIAFDARTQAINWDAPYLVEWIDRRHWRRTLLEQS